jgi:hypothetical protein
MKTAIYIEDGVVQLVLTPENKFEQNALSSFKGKPMKTSIKLGQFYDCQGGWTRHGSGGQYDGLNGTDHSLIVRTEEEITNECRA